MAEMLFVKKLLITHLATNSNTILVVLYWYFTRVSLLNVNFANSIVIGSDTIFYKDELIMPENAVAGDIPRLADC